MIACDEQDGEDEMSEPKDESREKITEQIDAIIVAGEADEASLLMLAMLKETLRVLDEMKERIGKLETTVNLDLKDVRMIDRMYELLKHDGLLGRRR